MSKDAKQIPNQEPLVRKWVNDKFLADYFGVHRKTIWEWSKTGRLPKPKKIGPNSTRWNFEDIEASEAAA